MKKGLLAGLLLFMSMWTVGQSLNIQLADEYFSKGDLDKAHIFYAKAIKANEAFNDSYDNYIATLTELGEFSELEKYLKKAIKRDAENYLYRVDYALVKRMSSGQDDYEKLVEDIQNEVKRSNLSLQRAIDAFGKRRLIQESIDLYKMARQVQKSSSRYAADLATLYKFQGKKELMVDELIVLLDNDPSQLEGVQNTLQIELTTDDERNMLVAKLYAKIQGASSVAFNQLLVWLYVQQKDFYNAFTQERAIDRREGLRGSRLLDLGDIAMKNQDYQAAVKIFSYVTEKYPDDYNYVLSQRKLIQAKEALAKVTYPVDTVQIKSLIADYESLLTRTNRVNDVVEIKRSIALLNAFYLHDIEEAIAVLQAAINTPRAQRMTLAQCKLDLGDIYILAEQPWESTLLYSQVEKDLKDNRLAHQAKLKNSKLSYYKGDFTLAQAHLDVLKLATTREIANDAMDLSLLIKDNLALDTSAAALEAYAAVELLVYQKKYDDALTALDRLLSDFPNHALTDEVYFQKGLINKNIGRYPQAVEFLTKMVEEFDYDILTDDATFMLAEIYEFHLKDVDKAMDLYKKMLIEYPGSIYAAESRKRYRALRGDKIN